MEARIDRHLIASLNIAALPEPPLDLEARLSLLSRNLACK